MSVLEKVLNLKKSGVSEKEIITKLKNEGISPMEINDAINQSKIKEAVSGEQEDSTKGMVPSIMGGEEKKIIEEETYTPSPSPSKEETYQDYSSQEDQGTEEYGSIGEYYEEAPSQEYSSGNETGMGSETMIEIAEQVFSEKIKKIEEELRTLKEFKTIASPNLEDLRERIKRIEKNFDKMQIAILERVGSFGKNINSLQKEVEMVEDSFGKIMKEKK